MKIVLNNKCNFIIDEFIKYQMRLSEIKSSNELILCPSNIYLSKFYLENFKLGSQNVSSYYEGAYTGEVAASQLKEMGVEYCIVGHSERRKYQNETNQEINNKIKLLLDNDITPIICVGETKTEREKGVTIIKILTDLEDCLRDIDNIKDVIIAYEPLWAIGTGIAPQKEEIDSVLLNIKKDYPENILLYGGSLNKQNIISINESTVIDGYLLGGLSLKVEELKEFIEKIEK